MSSTKPLTEDRDIFWLHRLSQLSLTKMPVLTYVGGTDSDLAPPTTGTGTAGTRVNKLGLRAWTRGGENLGYL